MHASDAIKLSYKAELENQRTNAIAIAIKDDETWERLSNHVTEQVKLGRHKTVICGSGSGLDFPPPDEDCEDASRIKTRFERLEYAVHTTYPFNRPEWGLIENIIVEWG